jgi:carboxypeptidase family protein
MTKRACFKGSVLVCAIALFGFIQPLVFAQLTTAGIVGTVSDPSGSRIPGVTVTALQIETSTPTTTTTDSSGNYTFTNLKIGKYSLTFQKEGFQRIVQSNVDLGIAQVIRFDIALKVGSVSQTVEVTDAPPLLQTETSSLGTIETEKRIEDLPLNGRNFFKLTYLAPGTNEGATGTSAGVGSTDNNRPGTALSVNGMRIFDNNFLLDGMDNNEFGNGTVVIQPPPDSIQEFRIEQNSMSAEYGRGGAMVSLVLRSGTNQLHGSAWEFLRNNKFDALNYFATRALGFQRNQYGGQLGGPIVKDKVFIFGSIQRSDIREEVPFISSVPSVLMHSGNFSELSTTITNPYTGIAYPGNIIPNASDPTCVQPGCINDVGKNIVDLYPNPNIPGAGLSNNFIFNGKYKFDETAFETRFDYNISPKDRFFAHYAIATPKATNPSNFPNVDGGLGSGTSSTLDNRVQAVAFDWNHIFNPGLLNDARVGFNRFKDATLPLDFGTNAGNAVGIPNANHGGNSSGLTKMNISGYQQLGDSLWVPETIAENVYQLADTLSWTRGKHSFKFGVDFRRQQRNFFQQTAPSGQLQFSGNYSGYGLADVLLGIPQNTLQDHLAGKVDPTRYWDLSEFVQDNIRVTPNLTLNLGLRYEINSPANGPTVGNFDLRTLTVNTSSRGGVKFDKNDWAPRVGFAWNVRQNTVVRSAFGIFYAAEGNIFDDLGLNPPSLAVQSFNWPGSNPSTNQLLQAFPTTFTQPDPSNPTGVVRTTGVIGTSSFDPVRRIPRIYEWNLTVEQQLSPNWLFRIGYVGTKSNNLFDHESSNLNQPLVPLDSNFSGSGTFGYNQGRPFFATRPGLNVVLPLDVARLSMFYNGLQTSVEHRFAEGFNILAAYTFAKSLGTADGNVNQCDVQNAHNVAAERGPTTPDFRHQLTVSYVYELPYGKGKHFGSSANSVAQAVLGGWQVAGVTRARSGEAFDVLLGGDVTNTGAFPPRPDAIHNPYDFSFNVAAQADPKQLACSKPGHQTLDCWFNQAAFVVPALSTAPGDCGGQCFARNFGNARRAALRGPDMVNFDFSAYKTFQLGERFGLQFRAEFFNIFNHPNFNLPNLGSGGGSSGAGIVNFSCTNAAPPVPTDCSKRSGGGAAITQTLPDAQREIQFGLKLQF